MKFEYWVSAWSRPEKRESNQRVETIKEADELVKEILTQNPAWRCTIYPKQTITANENQG